MVPGTQNQQELDVLLTPEEVSELLHIPKKTLYQWSYSHTGPKTLKVGRHLRYRRSDVEAWLDECTQPRGRRAGP